MSEELNNIRNKYKSSHEYVDPITAESKTNAIPGFTMSSKTRPLVITKMEEFIRNKLVKIYSKRLYNEMNTFVWQSGRPQAMKKFNDDLIMACAIGCWVKEVAFEAGQRDAAYKKAFLNSMIYTNTQLNTSIKGQVGYKKIDKNQEMKKYKDYLWLIKG